MIWVLYFYFFIFSRVPELHINGRFLSHNSSLETNASYDTISSLMVTGRSYNSTIAIRTPTNTMDSENLFCGIVSFIIYFCFIMIGIWIVRKRQLMKTRESQDSNESIVMDPLSPPNSMQTCN